MIKINSKLTPQKIAEITGGRYIGQEDFRDISVHGAVRDHRDVKKDNLFVCIKGERVDGHDFAAPAYEAGAACLLCEREIPDGLGPYVLVGSTLEAIRTLGAAYRQMFDIPIIGITGSVGKTTGKEMIAAALGSRLNVLRTPGNLNNQIGVPLTLLSLDDTHEAAVIEMGINHFGDMTVLTQMVMPDIMVLTKIGYAHLDNLGDLDGVLKAKTEVFDIVDKNAIAVLNGDDERLWGYDPKIRKITYGFNERNDYRAENMHVSGTDSVSFRACLAQESIGQESAGQKSAAQQSSGQKSACPESFDIKIPGFGAHLTMSAMAAVVVGRLLGIKNEDIARGLTTYAPVGGRANVSHTGYITLINDAYNANPNSVRAALESVSVLTGRRVAILGDMINLAEFGDEMHKEIGICAKHTGIDSLICNGPQAELIYNAFVAEGGIEARYFKSKEELIKELPALIQKDDNVLVKASNGMKFDEIVDVLKELKS